MSQLPLHITFPRGMKPFTLSICLLLLPGTRIISFAVLKKAKTPLLETILSYISNPTLDMSNINCTPHLDEAGRLLFDLGYYKQAQQCFARGLELSPGEPTLVHNMGTCQLELGLYNEALACFDLSLKNDSLDIRSRSRRALCLSHVRHSYHFSLRVTCLS